MLMPNTYVHFINTRTRTRYLNSVSCIFGIKIRHTLVSFISQDMSYSLSEGKKKHIANPHESEKTMTNLKIFNL
jgi:hypothetical protein